MEIKVHCRCGQPYRFTVEPEDGRMPVPVYCPVCGAEGTTEANTFIQFVSVLWPANTGSRASLAVAAGKH
jgi:hypothetical protein